ncbi:MAG TPA: RNA methyltransferase substrate-binding domain-containing protein, partial [Steroidobacteraceae bacterium]|nr:RNA methyltransferase substrate-binding domain-containing protein [Steroidobacteraceae bacterium]
MSSPSTEVVYGLHTVRMLLTRQPQRVSRVFLQAGRNDPRAAQIEALARSAQRPVERLDGRRFESRLGNVVHQGVMAQVTPLRPWQEEDLFEALVKASE